MAQQWCMWHNLWSNSYTYKMDDDMLMQEHVDTYKDLGVLFDPLLLFDQHISNNVNNAYSMLGELSRDCFVTLYISPR